MESLQLQDEEWWEDNMSPCKEHSEHSGSSHLSQAQNNDPIFLYTATIVQVINT
jgi:hypothetical protein